MPADPYLLPWITATAYNPTDPHGPILIWAGAYSYSDYNSPTATAAAAAVFLSCLNNFPSFFLVKYFLRGSGDGGEGGGGDGGGWQYESLVNEEGYCLICVGFAFWLAHERHSWWWWWKKFIFQGDDIIERQLNRDDQAGKGEDSGFETITNE